MAKNRSKFQTELNSSIHLPISTLPQYLYNYQTNFLKNSGPPYQGQLIGLNSVNLGNAYQGVGVGSNYNSFIPLQNRPNSGAILPITYNTDFHTNKNLMNLQQQQQQLPNKNYFYNSNNNAWQKINANNPYNKPGNRYSPGSQGWYATGGNYLKNNEQSIATYPSLLMISILILAFCK
ncbi:unnamed protein product [Rotaria magnacalcarata]